MLSMEEEGVQDTEWLIMRACDRSVGMLAGPHGHNGVGVKDAGQDMCRLSRDGRAESDEDCVSVKIGPRPP